MTASPAELGDLSALVSDTEAVRIIPIPDLVWAKSRISLEAVVS